MAVNLIPASSQALIRSEAVITAVPFTVLARFRTQGVSYPLSGGGRTIFHVVRTGQSPNENYFHLYYDDSGLLKAFHRANNGGGAISGVAETSEVIPLDEWVSAAAVFATQSSRSVYWNGANKGTNTTVIPDDSPSGLDRTEIGRRDGGGGFGLSQFWSGDLAEIAIYSRVLTDAEILDAHNAKRVDITRHGLVNHWRLIGGDSCIDTVGGKTLTPVNTPAAVDHPPTVGLIRRG